MVDPPIAIALAGVVLAIALTLRYSRPVPGIDPSPIWPVEPRAQETSSTSDDDGSSAAPVSAERAQAQIASLLPPGLTLFARMPRVAPRNSLDHERHVPGDPVPIGSVICDAMFRPVALIALEDADRPADQDGFSTPDRKRPPLPTVAIPPDADRATIAALLAPIIAGTSSLPT